VRSFTGNPVTSQPSISASEAGSYSAAQLTRLVEDESLVVHGDPDRRVRHPRPLQDAVPDALAFCNVGGEEGASLIANTRAGIVVIPMDAPVGDDAERTWLRASNPRRAFLRIIARAFAPAAPAGIHPSAVVDPSARVHESAWIGPRAVVGKVSIGAGSVVHAGVVLHDRVQLGERVTIHAGAVIGADGFGYARLEDGRMEKFLHFGGVIIHDDVEIGANSCIDRGTLGDTIIQRGAKIDNLVHIAHNVVVGADAVVIALSVIGGSTTIGDRAWVAPGSCVRDGIAIGADATVGLGAVVTKTVPSGATVLGAPARDVVEFRRMMASLAQLAT
jgi:UDP-3-O-[3-hydroxymyristoyl] glucosamine N-acyltransferase